MNIEDVRETLHITLEGLYNKIIKYIDYERRTKNLSWKELSEKSGVPMGSIVYAFIEKYSTFHVRLKFDELLKLCVALDIDISLFPLRMYGIDKRIYYVDKKEN